MWLDEYERRARLVPGMLMVAPVALTVVIFGLSDNAVVSAIVGSFAAFGAPVVLSNFVRHRGLSVQGELYEQWGGKPTTQLLNGAPLARRQAWRAAVEAVSGMQLPAVGEANEHSYDAAVAAVISKTRDPKVFRLLFAESRNYGYERNLYGLRKLGLALATACLLGAAFAVGVLAGVEDWAVQPEWVVGLVALIGALLLWMLLPSRDRTRTTAFKYAEQLLDAAVELARQP